MGRLTFNWSLAWSLIAIGILSIAVVANLVPVLSEALSPKPSARAVVDEVTRLMTEHDETQMVYRDRFNGRSVFFEPPARKKPPPPTPPITDIVKVDQPEKVDLEPPPAPARYGGPAIVAILGDTVWFEGGKRVAVGEEVDGIEVVALNSAWSAQIGWSRGEYAVSIYDVPEGFGSVALADREVTIGDDRPNGFGSSSGSSGRSGSASGRERPGRSGREREQKGPPE
jgi:hypothetical protein